MDAIHTVYLIFKHDLICKQDGKGTPFETTKQNIFGCSVLQ